MSFRANDKDQFLELGIEVVGISADHPYSQKAFAGSLDLPFPLVSDYPDGKTIQAYGVGYREGTSKRLYARQAFFLIDKAGIVQGFWIQRAVSADEIWAPDPEFSSEPILMRARELVAEK